MKGKEGEEEKRGKGEINKAGILHDIWSVHY